MTGLKNNSDPFFFSIRKSEKMVKVSLESIIVPMFCSAMMRANEDQKSKLNKVCKMVIVQPDVQT